jgi:hypothetical protein
LNLREESWEVKAKRYGSREEREYGSSEDCRVMKVIGLSGDQVVDQLNVANPKS